MDGRPQTAQTTTVGGQWSVVCGRSGRGNVNSFYRSIRSGLFLTRHNGKAYALNRNGARLTLAVFFKTTCPTCMLAFPYIERAHQTYQSAGLQAWGLSQDPREPSAEFAQQYGCTFPILDDSAWRVSKTYDPEFVPTSLLIDPHGKIIESAVAFQKSALNRLAQVIAANLRVPAAAIAPANDGNPEFKAG